MRFHLAPRKTRELLRIARALEDLPQIDAAFAEGEVLWSAVREISRVATKETEKEWLDLARESSMRKIEQAVSRARYGEQPPRDPYGLSHLKLKVLAELSLEDHAIWQSAFDRVAADFGGELDAATVLLVLAKQYLEQPLNRQETEARKVFQVVYHRCTECQRAWMQTEDGPAGIPVAKVAAREPLAKVLRLPTDTSEADAEKVNNPSERIELHKAAGDGVIPQQINFEKEAAASTSRESPELPTTRNGMPKTGAIDLTAHHGSVRALLPAPRGARRTPAEGTANAARQTEYTRHPPAGLGP